MVSIFVSALLDYVLAQSHHVATAFPNLSYMHPSSYAILDSLASEWRGSGLSILRRVVWFCASGQRWLWLAHPSFVSSLYALRPGFT